MNNVQQVFLIWQHEIFRDTAKAVLTEAGVPLVGESSHLQEALQAIDSLRPPVILVESGEGLAETVLAGLPDDAGIRVVRMSMEDNILQIHERHQRMMVRPSDLVDVLQSVPTEAQASTTIHDEVSQEESMEEKSGVLPRRFLVIGGIAAVAFVLLAGYLLLSGQAQAAPPQPIAFSHQKHVEAGTQCLFCHSGAMRSAVASVPSVQKCVGCHLKFTPEKEADRIEAEKVLKAWKDGTPIRWNRVYDLPDFVYFSHRPHIKNGVNCESCHGDVSKMDTAQEVYNVNMGFCLDCHRKQERAADLIDCAVCHK
ncbi:MAG: cytochrome c3 family protein [Chloroflexi bacterium]|nr:cytochrome c3 family protein [Chloroflexota bacterium]